VVTVAACLGHLDHLDHQVHLAFVVRLYLTYSL
jgi:hypothetical protein